jgi:hypothetical protein
MDLKIWLAFCVGVVSCALLIHYDWNARQLGFWVLCLCVSQVLRLLAEVGEKP